MDTVYRYLFAAYKFRDIDTSDISMSHEYDMRFTDIYYEFTLTT